MFGASFEKAPLLSRAEIEAICYRSIKGWDKWNRMFNGFASSLERYENGIVYLKIENTEKKETSILKTALWVAQSWVKWNDELSRAKGFVVSFYESSATGFMFNAAGAETANVIFNAVRQLIAAGKQKKELVKIYSGLFADYPKE